jgi:uncharacterized protein (TIGR02117 family)
LLLVLVLGLTGVGWGDRSLYPARRADDAVKVLLVSNGFHSGLILPRAALADAAGRSGRSALISVSSRFQHFDWVEVGWGDDAFYRATPTLDSFDWKLGLRAVLGFGGGSVIHVFGVLGDLRETYGNIDLVALSLSPEGFGRLLDRLDGSFVRDVNGFPVDLGRGLSAASLFYGAHGTFFFGQMCNHWTAGLLAAAGVPISALLATWPRGLVFDLMHRSGLSLEPAALPHAGVTQ